MADAPKSRAAAPRFIELNSTRTSTRLIFAVAQIRVVSTSRDGGSRIWVGDDDEGYFEVVEGIDAIKAMLE